MGEPQIPNLSFLASTIRKEKTTKDNLKATSTSIFKNNITFIAFQLTPLSCNQGIFWGKIKSFQTLCKTTPEGLAHPVPAPAAASAPWTAPGLRHMARVGGLDDRAVPGGERSLALPLQRFGMVLGGFHSAFLSEFKEPLDNALNHMF